MFSLYNVVSVIEKQYRKQHKISLLKLLITEHFSLAGGFVSQTPALNTHTVIIKNKCC